MYFLKTEGTNKIPDYVQIRDDDFVLIAHFRTRNYKNQIKKSGLQAFKERIEELIKESPFGMLYKL